MLTVEPIALSMREAVKISGIGRTKLFSEIRQGKLEARKCGRRTLITPHALRAYVESLPARTQP